MRPAIKPSPPRRLDETFSPDSLRLFEHEPGHDKLTIPCSASGASPYSPPEQIHDGSNSLRTQSHAGHVHIGNIRAAIYNWLFAHHHGGRFLLRVEDTDRERSTPEAIQANLDAMVWLGLNYDEEAVYQSTLKARHVAAAEELLDKGLAYRSRRRDRKRRGRPFQDAGHRNGVHGPHQGPAPQGSQGSSGFRHRPFGRPSRFPPRERRRRPDDEHHARHPRRRPRRKHLPSHRAVPRARGHAFPNTPICP